MGAGRQLAGPGGPLAGLTKQVLESALRAGPTEYLGHEHGQTRSGRTRATAPGPGPC